MKSIIERARAYIFAMPPAISGEGGHLATFKVALALVKGFALNEDTSFGLLGEWNHDKASPLWNAKQLRHKIRSAGRSARPMGYLLDSRAVLPVVSTPDEGWKCFPYEEEEPRTKWPALLHLNRRDIKAIAEARHLPLEVIQHCSQLGFLSKAELNWLGCYVIHEGDFAQARRINGLPFHHHGESIKAMNLPGSKGAFVGQSLITDDQRPVLLVEGAVGILEARAAIYLAGNLEWLALAATSAYSQFAREPRLLATLSKRHVRILADNDSVGSRAADSWMEALLGSGGKADVLHLPHTYKDLGEFIADPFRSASMLNSIFTL